MSETVIGNGMAPGEEAVVTDPHEEEARNRWKIYTVIFVALFVLTVLELYVGSLFSEKSAQVAVLVALMLAKASLVVLYYMHLRWESRVLRWLIIIPFFAAVFFLTILLWV
ncbi:MAG: cytochrome C oxidase subunit IV family protein [Thermoplasmata archaeon]|nr:cytochrome C oxidase subunit IV family protein [Thermoplasmata archaeon]